MPVHVSDKAVVVFHSQRETPDGCDVRDVERDADIHAAVHIVHRRLDVCRELRREPGQRILIPRLRFARRDLAPVNRGLIDAPGKGNRRVRRHARVIAAKDERIRDVHRVRVRPRENRDAIQIRCDCPRDVARHHEMIPGIIRNGAAARADEAAVVNADRSLRLRREMNAEIAARAFVREQVATRRRIRGVEPHLDRKRPRSEVERRIIRHNDLRRSAGEIHARIRRFVAHESRRTRPHRIDRRSAIDARICGRAERTRVCRSRPARFVKTPCTERADARRDRGRKRHRRGNRPLVMRKHFRRRNLASVNRSLIDSPRHRRAGACGSAAVIRAEEQRVRNIHRLRVRAGKDRRAVQIRCQRPRDIPCHHEMIPRIVGYRAARRADKPVVENADFPRHLRRKMNPKVASRAFVSEEVAAPGCIRRIEPHLHRKRPGAKVKRRMIRNQNPARAGKGDARIRCLEAIEIPRTRADGIKRGRCQKCRIFRSAE